MNLNFGIGERVRSTARKVVQKVADKVSASAEALDREWRAAFFAMLKVLRPWPEARMAIVDMLRAKRDAARW